MTEQQNLDTLGWDDVADSRPTIPNGEYTLKFVGAKVEQKQNASTYYIPYNAVVQAGPNAGYTIFGGMWSLKPDQLWRFKRDLKNLGVTVEPGLSALEAASEVVKIINGMNFVGLVGTQVRRVKDDSGDYVPDPDGTMENTIARIIGPEL